MNEAIDVVRKCSRCGEELRARVRAYGADHADAKWVAEGFARTAPCPRCEKSGLATLTGAALWDGFRWWFSTSVALSVVAAIIGAGFLGSTIVATIGVVLACVFGIFVGVRKGRATVDEIRADASSRVFWFFCVECKKGIVDGRDAWMTCERCSRAVHEPCAMAHASSHVAMTAYRGSASS